MRDPFPNEDRILYQGPVFIAANRAGHTPDLAKEEGAS